MIFYFRSTTLFYLLIIRYVRFDERKTFFFLQVKLIFFSCDANNFELSLSQRKVIRTVNQYINDNIKPGDALSTSEASASRTPPITNKTKQNRSTNVKPTLNNNKISLYEWIKMEPNTNARQLIQHILTRDTRMIKFIFLNFSILF